MPGWGDTQSDDLGDDLSSSTGEFLGEEEEDVLETLDIEDVDDLPPVLNFEDAESLSIRNSVSLVWLSRLGELDLFQEPVLSVWVGLETFLLLAYSNRASFRVRESRELLGGDLDSKARGDTRASIDLPEEEVLEQLPDRLGTAPRGLVISILFGDLGGELVGGGGLSEKIAASIELCVSCLLAQPLS